MHVTHVQARMICCFDNRVVVLKSKRYLHLQFCFVIDFSRLK